MFALRFTRYDFFAQKPVVYRIIGATTALELAIRTAKLIPPDLYTPEFTGLQLLQNGHMIATNEAAAAMLSSLIRRDARATRRTLTDLKKALLV